jgi:serine/threonine-protein kinase RsbW
MQASPDSRLLSGGPRNRRRVAITTEARDVQLTVPAKPDYIVLARLALSAVCRLTPLQPEDVADLKLAITEAATGVMGSGPEDQLSFAFHVGEDRLVLEIGGSAQAGISDEEEELGRAIVEATVDECERSGGTMRLVKYLDGVAD